MEEQKTYNLCYKMYVCYEYAVSYVKSQRLKPVQSGKEEIKFRA